MHPESPLILTIDIGTSSARAMLFDSRAKSVPGCVAQTPYQMQTTRDGGAEFDANHLFEAAVGTVDTLLAQAGPLAEQIGGVAVDTMVTNIIGFDAAGQPITPVLTYADTRSVPDVQKLKAEFGSAGEAEIHNRTGCKVHSTYLPARFLWLARTQPARLNAVVHWASIGEYLLWRLFGQWQASYSMASWTGLLNRHSLSWDKEWLSMLPVEVAQFSPLCDVTQPMRGLQSEWANRWPALRDVPWFPAIGDGAAANIGSGCGDASRLALTIGTTGAMRVVLPSNLPVVPPGLWLYRVDANRGLLGGATTEGGSVFAWLRDTLQLPPADELELQLAAMPPAAHGLTILPFIGGERAPGWRDDARASLVGFSMNTRPVEIVQAGLESVAYRFALIYGLIANNLPQSEHQIVAGGGVLNSPAWLQIFADVLGKPVLTLVETEATSRGAALLALESLGVIGSTMDLLPETGKTYEPITEHHVRYHEAIARQVDAYARLLGD